MTMICSERYISKIGNKEVNKSQGNALGEATAKFIFANKYLRPIILKSLSMGYGSSEVKKLYKDITALALTCKS
jgi:hypothetical protein